LADAKTIERGDAMGSDAEATVRVLLAAQGLNPPHAEIAAIAESYPTLRATADALYFPEASRYLPAFSPHDDADLEAR
jgi:hypothetical protein